MWQRKQTLFLFVAAILLAATWWLPINLYEVDGRQYELRTTGLYNGEGGEEASTDMPFQWLATAAAAVLVVVAFLYRDRMRQVRVARGVFLVILLIIAFIFITDRSSRVHLSESGEVVARYGWSYFLPMASLIFTYLAVRSIQADEELVRSADRLR